MSGVRGAYPALDAVTLLSGMRGWRAFRGMRGTGCAGSHPIQARFAEGMDAGGTRGVPEAGEVVS